MLALLLGVGCHLVNGVSCWTTTYKGLFLRNRVAGNNDAVFFFLGGSM